MYLNVTLRRVRSTIVAVEKQYALHILSICSRRYPACSAHAPYCHLWPALFYSIFPHYLIINGTIFVGWGGVGEIDHEMYVLILSTTFSETLPHSKIN